MSSVVTEFPDQTYTTSNKPSVETLKSDIAALETGHNDLQSAAVLLTGTQSITGVKTMTTPVLESPVVKAWSGWQLYSAVTPTYTSADDPTYVITFAGVDLTSIMSVGMKVKFTNNSTTFYGFITALSFSTDTVMTLYGGTDYDVANSAISGFYFSTDRCPQGFPMDQTKWTVKVTDTTSRSQASPVQNTWYNLGSITINIPIGAWDVDYQVSGYFDDSTSTILGDIWFTLSTGNNSETDKEFTARNYMYTNSAVSGSGGCLYTRSKQLVVASKTSYYLNEKTAQSGLAQLVVSNDNTTCVIRAICAYL